MMIHLVTSICPTNPGSVDGGDGQHFYRDPAARRCRGGVHASKCARLHQAHDGDGRPVQGQVPAFKNRSMGGQGGGQVGGGSRGGSEFEAHFGALDGDALLQHLDGLEHRWGNGFVGESDDAGTKRRAGGTWLHSPPAR